MEEGIVTRLRKRAEIRRTAKGRKSVEEGKADRLAELLEEAATTIESLELEIQSMDEDAAGASL